LANKRTETAYAFLGKSYGIKNPFVIVNGIYNARPELLNAINKDPGVKIKPGKTNFDPTDFKNIAGLPNFSPLVGQSRKNLR
jgi:hypothetical protein